MYQKHYDKEIQIRRQRKRKTLFHPTRSQTKTRILCPARYATSKRVPQRPILCNPISGTNQFIILLHITLTCEYGYDQPSQPSLSWERFLLFYLPYQISLDRLQFLQPRRYLRARGFVLFSVLLFLLLSACVKCELSNMLEVVTGQNPGKEEGGQRKPVSSLPK